MKRLTGIIFLTAIVTFVVQAKENLIIPEIGVGNLLINHQIPPEFNSVEYADKGIFLSGSDGIIKSIFITNPLFKTKEGIKVGDSTKTIFQIFGTREIYDLKLQKGNIQIGNMGKAISYGGIIFIIKNRHVTGILIKENTKK